MPGKRLRDGERLAIVAASTVDPNQSRLAKAFGVSRGTINALLNDEKLLHLSDNDFDQAGRILSTMMLSNSVRGQQHVTDKGLKKLNPVQLAIFSKINIEGARLLREKPTSITKHDSVTDLASTVLGQLKNSLDVIDGEIVPGDSPLNDSPPSNKPAENEAKASQSVDAVAKPDDTSGII